MSNTVWKFTNGRELSKSEFINYFERKAFRTIRKFQMLPEDKTFTLKKSNDLNTTVLKQILETKFQVEQVPTTDHRPSTTDSSNLSQIAENTFQNIIKGNFDYKTPENAPLIHLSDKEVELYAKLKNIEGTKRKQDKRIQSLFEKFLNKNQDLEINILNAQNQINQTE